MVFNDTAPADWSPPHCRVPLSSEPLQSPQSWLQTAATAAGIKFRAQSRGSSPGYSLAGYNPVGDSCSYSPIDVNEALMEAACWSSARLSPLRPHAAASGAAAAIDASALSAGLALSSATSTPVSGSLLYLRRPKVFRGWRETADGSGSSSRTSFQPPWKKQLQESNSKHVSQPMSYTMSTTAAAAAGASVGGGGDGGAGTVDSHVLSRRARRNTTGGMPLRVQGIGVAAATAVGVGEMMDVSRGSAGDGSGAQPSGLGGRAVGNLIPRRSGPAWAIVKETQERQDRLVREVSESLSEPVIHINL